MPEKKWMTARESAKFLGLTKPQIYRLIKQGKLVAKLNSAGPISYYEIEKTSITAYKIAPKNKGGRPKKEKS